MSTGSIGTGLVRSFCRVPVDNPKVLRFFSGLRFGKTVSGQAALEQFADRGRPCRHPARKTPIIDGLQFLGSNHDLQTLFAAQPVHGFVPLVWTHKKLPNTNVVSGTPGVKG